MSESLDLKVGEGEIELHFAAAVTVAPSLRLAKVVTLWQTFAFPKKALPSTNSGNQIFFFAVTWLKKTAKRL